MIRTVRIPRGVSRMGCAPGGDCCSSCKGHRTGPPIGQPSVHVHQLAGAQSGTRNAALHNRLGSTPDITATIIGDDSLPDDPGAAQALADWAAASGSAADQQALNAQILNSGSLGLPYSAGAAAGTSTGISPTLLYIGGALALVVLLEALSRKR